LSNLIDLLKQRASTVAVEHSLDLKLRRADIDKELHSESCGKHGLACILALTNKDQKLLSTSGPWEN
jgi:hypothetical protein